MARARATEKTTIPPVTTVWSADKIEPWPLDKLIPYARNARQHSPDQIDQLADSILEFGFTIPVLVNKAGELIAGHGRVLAASQLGLPFVPTIVATGWSDRKVKAYRIVDNKLALNATWNPEFLATEIAELREFDDFEDAILGFSPIELARVIEDARLMQLETYSPETESDETQDEEGDDPVSDLVNFTLAMTRAQRHEIYAALALAKELSGIETSVLALLDIIAVWHRSVQQ